MASGRNPYDRSRRRDPSQSPDKRHPVNSNSCHSPPRRAPTRSRSPVRVTYEAKRSSTGTRDRDRGYRNDTRGRGQARDRHDPRESTRDWERSTETHHDRDQRRDSNRDRNVGRDRTGDRGRIQARDRDDDRNYDRENGWVSSRDRTRDQDQEGDPQHQQQQSEYQDLDQEEHERDLREPYRLDYSERDNSRFTNRYTGAKNNRSYNSNSRSKTNRAGKGTSRAANPNDYKSNPHQRYDHFKPSGYNNRSTNGRRTGTSRSRSPPRRPLVSQDLEWRRDEGASRKKRRLDSSERNRDRSHTKQTGRVRRASNSRSRSRSRSQTCTPASPHPDGRSPSQASSYRHRSPSPLPPQPPRPPRRVQRSISISQTSHIKSPGSRHSRSCSPHPPLPPRKPRRLRTQTPCSPSSGSSIDGRPCKVPSRSTRRGISPSRSADSRHWDVEGGSVGRVRPITTPNDHSPSSRNSYSSPGSRRHRSSSSRPHRRATSYSSTSRGRASSPASSSRFRIERRASLEADLGPPPKPPKPPVGPRFAQRDTGFRRGRHNHGAAAVTGSNRQHNMSSRLTSTSRQTSLKSRGWEDPVEHVPNGSKSHHHTSSANGSRLPIDVPGTPPPIHSPVCAHPSTPPPPTPPRLPPRSPTPPPPPPPPRLPAASSSKLPASPRRIKSTVNPLLRPPGMPPIAPVAQTSAGVRRFFPDDDDDDEINGAVIEPPSKSTAALWHPVEFEKPEPALPQSPLPALPPPPPAALPASPPHMSPLPTTRAPSLGPSIRRSRTPSPSARPEHRIAPQRTQDPRLHLSGRSREPRGRLSPYRPQDRNHSNNRDRSPRWHRRHDDFKPTHEHNPPLSRYPNAQGSSSRPSHPVSSNWEPPPPMPESVPVENRADAAPSTMVRERRSEYLPPVPSPSRYPASGSQHYHERFYEQPPNELPHNADPHARFTYPSSPHTLPPVTTWASHAAVDSRPVSKDVYERIVQVGEGTYGKVYKARNVETGGLVAMKRIRMEAEKDGFPITAIREIKLLQGLRHPNIVNLVEMVVSKGHVYIVFEYLDHDLSGVLHHPNIHFSEANIKSLMWQLLAGLQYMHEAGVLHRDLKGSNILLNKAGELKIADFGLARRYERGKEPGREGRGRGRDYTNRVITLWYKPPELLFGATVYGEEVDMWSAGAIFLELYTRRPIFQANDEIDQLHATFKLMGTPTSTSWKEVTSLPWYELVKPKTDCPSKLRETFFDGTGGDKMVKSEGGMILAESLLEMNPARRPSAREAMGFNYFSEEAPEMEIPRKLLSSVKGEWHELESKRARKQRREGER